MAKRARHALGALFGFGQETVSPRGQGMRQLDRRAMAKLRDIAFSPGYMPSLDSTNTEQHLENDERRKGARHLEMQHRVESEMRSHAVRQQRASISPVCCKSSHIRTHRKVSELCLRKLLEISPPSRILL